MAVVPGADPGDRQTVDLARGRDLGRIGGIGLEDEQAVELHRGTGCPLDIGQPQVVVFQQCGLRALQFGEQFPGGRAVIDQYPDRQGVDEQADHGFDTGQFRGTAGYRGAEHHIVATGHPAEQHTPGGLHQGVHRDPEIGGPRGELSRTVRIDLRHHGVDLVVLRGHRLGCQQRGFGETGQRFAPGLPGGGRVTIGQPGQEVPVRGHPRQCGGIAAQRVQHQQFPHEQRHGPAVEQDVVAGDRQLPRVLGQPDEVEPDQRRHRHIEMLGLIRGQQPAQFVRAFALREPTQIDIAPRHRHLVEDDLHPLTVRIGDERGPQVRVPPDHRLRGVAQPGRVHTAGQIDRRLHGVDVHAVLDELGVEQQTRLQRRQRPHLRQRRVGVLPPFDIALRNPHQRHIGGGETACGRPADMVGQRGEGGDPQVRELTCPRLGEQSTRVGEDRVQHRALGAGVDDGIDIQHGIGGHIPVRVRADRTQLAGRHPAELGEFGRDLTGGDAAQIVEADLPRHPVRQPVAGIGVQIAEQTVAQTLVRYREQLFLHRFHQDAEGGATRESIVEIDPRQFQPDRMHGGEPADGAGQVGAGYQGLLATVTLQFDQCRRGPAVAAPASDRQCQRRQQGVVGTAVVAGTDGGQHRLGDIGGQRDLEPFDRRIGIDGRIEGARTQQRVRGGRDLLPVRQFRDSLRIGSGRGEPVRPPPQRGPDRWQRHRGPGRELRPGQCQVRDEDAPRDAVDHEVMGREEQHIAPVAVEREPHELRHHRRGRIQPIQCGVEFGGSQPDQFVVADRVVEFDPAYQGVDIDRTGFERFEHRHPVRDSQPGAQGIVMVEHRRQGRDEGLAVDTHRQPQQHRL